MIQAYINKILKIQQEQKEKPLDVDEMHKIAEDLGMSPQDLAFIQKKLDDYVARGNGYSRYEDWDSAIEEYEQAITLSPANVEALYGLANAYKHRWILRLGKDDLNNAKFYVKRALHVNPNHDASFKLASELNKGIPKNPKFGTFKDFGDPFNSTFKTDNDSILNSWKDLETIKFNTEKRLKKSNRDKKIFGVCAGIAGYFGIDSTWVRIGFILGAISGGWSIPLYVLMAFILPKN